MTAKIHPGAPGSLEWNISRKNSGALYKYILKNADDPNLDINDIIQQGFSALSSGGRASGAATPERAIKLLRLYPGRVSPRVVADVVKYTYDLNMLNHFMTDQPDIMTEQDLQDCANNLQEFFAVGTKLEEAEHKLALIKHSYKKLRNTPIEDILRTVTVIEA